MSMQVGPDKRHASLPQETRGQNIESPLEPIEAPMSL